MHQNKTPIPTKRSCSISALLGRLPRFSQRRYWFYHTASLLCQEKSLILSIHPQYFSQPEPPGGVDLAFGSPLLYQFLSFILQIRPTNLSRRCPRCITIPSLRRLVWIIYHIDEFATGRTIGRRTSLLCNVRASSQVHFAFCVHCNSCHWVARIAPPPENFYSDWMDRLALLGADPFFCGETGPPAGA